MSLRTASWLGLVAVWLVVLLTALLTRPLVPVDETRYAAVAWEMWQRGDFLVPYLNGEPYSHKPPMLFWLMHLGWAAFGINDWWPRLVAPLSGFAGPLGPRAHAARPVPRSAGRSLVRAAPAKNHQHERGSTLQSASRTPLLSVHLMTSFAILGCSAYFLFELAWLVSTMMPG